MVQVHIPVPKVSKVFHDRCSFATMQVWNDQQMQTNCNCRMQLQPFIGAPQLTTRCSELTIQTSTIFNCFNHIKSKSHPQKLQKIQKIHQSRNTFWSFFCLSGAFCSFMQFPNALSRQFFQNKTYASASHLLCNKEILFEPKQHHRPSWNCQRTKDPVAWQRRNQPQARETLPLMRLRTSTRELVWEIGVLKKQRLTRSLPNKFGLENEILDRLTSFITSTRVFFSCFIPLTKR